MVPETEAAPRADALAAAMTDMASIDMNLEGFDI